MIVLITKSNNVRIMIMKREELMSIAADAVNESELKSQDIPAISLYVDQILNLVGEKLKDGSERYHDRQLTKTMINNYSKDRVITPVKGKKYTKEQIIQILMVYSLKSTLSIGEIKRLLDGAYASEGFGAEDMTALYDRHLDIKNEGKWFAQSMLGDLIDNNTLDLSNDRDYITAVCALAALSNQLKNVAQAMIDVRFPEPVEEEEDQDAPSEKALEKEKAKMEKSIEKAKKKEAKKKKASDENADI
jgi:hypothetical protein